MLFLGAHFNFKLGSFCAAIKCFKKEDSRKREKKSFFLYLESQTNKFNKL